MAVPSLDWNHIFRLAREQGAGTQTNFTKTTHRSSYPAIDPTRPELSQKGRTVLITGGGTGIGFGIASSFIQAGAGTVIIAGRREQVLIDAKKQLDQEAQRAGKEPRVIAQVLDVTDKAAVAALWLDLKDKGIEVDVLVLNAAKFSPLQTIFELGSDEVWSMFEANVHGPLMLAEAFAKQGGDKPKVRRSSEQGPFDKHTCVDCIADIDLLAQFIVNVASQAIHLFDKSKNIIADHVPAYGLTKNAGALTLQQIANRSDPEKLQIINLHPGVIYNDAWKQGGISETVLPFDDVSLAGSSAVWLASTEARFLHGRFIWSSWDVDELKSGEIRKKIDEDVEFLKIGVNGLSGCDRAW